MMKKHTVTVTTPVSSIKPVDVTDTTFKANPFPFYAQLRTAAPVFPLKLPTRQRAWLVTRYDDVLNVLKDERFAKDPRNAMTHEQLKKLPWVPPMFKPLEHNMLDLDSSDHTRLRALVHKAFTPRLICSIRRGVNALWTRACSLVWSELSRSSILCSSRLSTICLTWTVQTIQDCEPSSIKHLRHV